MSGAVHYRTDARGDVASVVLDNAGKHNAIDIGMWRELRTLFERLQALPAGAAPRAVIVGGADGQFASGGDIAEFATFRFDEARLRDFHEQIVAPALHAMLACDIPLYAQIDGHCVGGGLEIAACCDIRICGRSSRFGAPIAKLGFPMAPLELALLARVAPEALLRELLLEARLVNAARAFELGLVHAVTDDDAVERQTRERALHAASLSPTSARINKRTLRQLAQGGPTAAELAAHYAYAAHAEHREGVMAFLEKRPPQFGRR
ncbi:MAG: enoyl-CoA hydratase/isomerase family protein [Proteobacteria bacterium]|nr:enoyl-CoA hydratase/isomerase family protein [Pseudomonadota bacterium]